MIRKLRTQRDDQQWMLDLALNMRGRVQNFERDDLEVPPGKRARNYRMQSLARSRGAARSAREARTSARRQRDGDYALRSRDRSVPHGAAPDLLRQPPRQEAD